jgi:hypothetical protein
VTVLSLLNDGSFHSAQSFCMAHQSESTEGKTITSSGETAHAWHKMALKRLAGRMSRNPSAEKL